MLKTSWIPTRILNERSRPTVCEPSPPSRLRALRAVRVVLALYASITWDRIRRRDDPLEFGVRLRTAFEGLGGLWIKVGHFISMRNDLFGPELCGAVGQLQDHGQGFPFRFVEQAITEDLGQPLDRLFSEFEETPFAADSIGQLHRAVLRKDGAEVAVKIRRPYVDRLMLVDSRLIRVLVLLANGLRLLPGFRWGEFYHELQYTLTHEIDFRYEASNLRRMRKNLKKHRKVYAPYVYRKLAGPRVLVMEFTRGVLMADVLALDAQDPEATRAWFAENQIDPDKVAERLFASQLRQRFIDNLFHSDLNPNNIVLLRGGRVCLINFGSLGRLDDELRTRFKELQEALTHSEFSKVIDLFLLIPPDLPLMDVELVRTELMRAIRAWELRARTKRMTFSEKSSVSLFSEMARIVTRHRIPLPWALLRLNRSSLTLDISLRGLNPKMNYFKVSRRAHRKIEKDLQRQNLRMLVREFDPAEMITGLSEGLHRTREEGLYKLEWMRRRARSFQAIPTKLAYGLLAVLNLIGLTVDVGAVFLIGLYLYQYHDAVLIPDGLGMVYQPIRQISAPGWVVIGLAGGAFYMQMLRIRARFREPDVELPGRRH